MAEQWMIPVDKCSLKSRFIGLKSQPLCIALSTGNCPYI